MGWRVDLLGRSVVEGIIEMSDSYRWMMWGPSQIYLLHVPRHALEARQPIFSSLTYIAVSISGGTIIIQATTTRG